MEDRKRRLFQNIRDGSHIVELGPGTGPNFRYYPSSAQWTGIEPNPFFAGVLKPYRLVPSTREIASASADAFVSTLVLCSVEDPAAELAEALRILKPGAPFYFLEHVAASPGSSLRSVQKLIQPVWRVVAGNCHPCRDTLHYIEAAGFDRIETEVFDLPVGPVTPHVAGIAYKRG